MGSEPTAAAQTLATRVASGTDVDGDLRRVARLIAAFHSAAPRSSAISAVAGPDGLRRRWLDRLRQAEALSEQGLDPDLRHQVSRSALRYVDGRTTLLSARADTGHAVAGHGALLAANVSCVPGGPCVLHSAHPDDEMRWVDEIDDLALLATDLGRLGRPELGTALFQYYVEFSGATVVSSLWHHYLAYRAFAQAVLPPGRQEPDVPDNGDVERLARAALDHLRAGEVRLTLVGGAPGTGKSTLAAALADRTGAVLLNSDTIRREQNWPADTRYDVQTKTATYAELFTRAEQLLERGESVVADATWSDFAWRRRARELAASTFSRQFSLECEAPVELAAARAERRRGAGGASEAGADVARTLAIHRDPWPEASRVDTSGSAAESVRRAQELLGAGG